MPVLALRILDLSKAPENSVKSRNCHTNYSKSRNKVPNDQLGAKSFLKIDDGLSDHVTDSPRFVADEALHRL